MDVYFCTGPYHVISAMNIKLSLNAEVQGDCYIFNRFRGAEQIAEKLRNERLFQNVYVLYDNPEKYSFEKAISPSFLKRIYLLLAQTKKKIRAGEYPIADMYKAYDRMYVAGFLPYLHRFIKSNVKNGMVIYCFDDGLSNRMRPDYYATKNTWYRRLLHVNTFSENVEGLVYYNFSAAVDHPRMQRILLPNMIVDKHELFWRVFDMNEDAFEKVRMADIIVLTSGMEVYDGRIPEAVKKSEEEQALYNEIIAQTEANVVFKVHPASKKVFDGWNTVRGIAPFELYMTGTDLSHKTIISPFSAALFNPKFVFGYEPTIILLYKTLEIDTQQWFGYSKERVGELIDDLLLSQYKDRKKIIIPEDKKELFTKMGIRAIM